MSTANSRFNIIFRAVGQNELKKVRSVLRGIEQQSYTSLNAFNRNMSSMERNTIKTLNSIDRRMGNFGKGVKTFSTLGVGLTSALTGFGAIISGLTLAHRAFISTNSQMQTSKILVEELLGSKGKATDFVNTMKDLSTSFGMDLSETMNSSRGLLQVMKQVGDGNVQTSHLDKMLKMVMAVSSMDIENRGLSYTAFSFKEAMQAMGQGDFRSLRNRLEINLGREVEKSITKALRAGNLDQALDLFDNGLKRIGIDSERLLNRMSKEGFVQNLSKLYSYTSRVFQIIGERMYYSLTEPFYKLNKFLERNFKEGSVGLNILTGLGDSFYDYFSPALNKLKEIGTELYKNKEVLTTLLPNLVKSTAGVGNSFAGMFLSFFKGLFGVKSDSKSQVEDMILLMKSLTNFANKVSTAFDKLSPILKGVGQSVHNIVSELSKIVLNSGLGKLGGGLVGIAGTVATVIAEGVAQILSTINAILGNKFGTNADGSTNSAGIMQQLVNGSIIAGVGLQILSMRGKGATRTGTSTGTLNNEARIVNEANVVRASGRNPNARALADIAGNNSLKIRELDMKIADRVGMFSNKGNTLAKLQSHQANLASKELKMQNIRGEIANSRNLINDPNTNKNNIPFLENNIAVKTKELTLLRSQIEYESIQIANLNKHIAGAKEYNQLVAERAKLLNSNKYIDKRINSIINPTDNRSMFQKAKDKVSGYFGGGTVLADAANVGFIGTSAYAGHQALSSSGAYGRMGGWLVTVGTRLVGLFNPVTLGLTAFVASLGLIKKWTDRNINDDKTIEDNRNIEANETLKIHKLRRFREFMMKNNFSAENIRNLYDKGFAGHAPNAQELATLYAGKGKGYKWGAGLEKEKEAQNKLIEAFRNGTIDPEIARQFLGNNAVNALATNVEGTIQAQLQLTKIEGQALKDLEEIITKAFKKEMEKNNNAKQGIQGTVDDIVATFGTLVGKGLGYTDSGDSSSSGTTE